MGTSHAPLGAPPGEQSGPEEHSGSEEDMSPVRPMRLAFVSDPETVSKQSKTTVDLRDD